MSFDSSSSSSDPEINLRVAVKADVEALVDLVNQAFEVERHFVRGSRTDPAEIAEKMVSGAFWVEHDPQRPRELVSCIHLGRRRDTGLFGMLCVAPRVQRAGRGRSLVEFAERQLFGAGCRTVEIEVVDRRVELVSWYEGLGYEVVSERPFRDKDRLLKPCRFLVMSKEWGRGEPTR